MTEYEFEKYVCTKETLKNTIEQYGVAIVPDILNSDECEQIVNGIWNFLEHISQNWIIPINRNDRETWREFYKLYPLHSMLLQYWGVGHIQASWNVRQNIKLVEIFAYFWNCNADDLLVSFDGLSFNLPPEITKKGWNRNNTWYHTDQSYMTPDFKCIQSYVTGLDINEYDATLSIMEGSNKYHNEFKNKYGITDKNNWYKLNREEQLFYTEKGCNIRNIKCPKGSLILWDSRTIHCGIEASNKRQVPNFRAIIYLCYMPRKLCSDVNLRKKQKAFNELRTTSHYPCNIKLFGKYPYSRGGELPIITPIEPPILTDLGRKLAGL